MHEIGKNFQLVAIVCRRSQLLNRSKVIDSDRMRTVATSPWNQGTSSLTPRTDHHQPNVDGNSCYPAGGFGSITEGLNSRATMAVKGAMPRGTT